MKGDYPRFKATYTHEELVEHFLLRPADRAVIDTCYGEVNRHGVAVLLKTVPYLGYFPDDLQQVPPVVRTFIAHQLQLLWDHTEDYPWYSRTRDRHMSLIRHSMPALSRCNPRKNPLPSVGCMTTGSHAFQGRVRDGICPC